MSLGKRSTLRSARLQALLDAVPPCRCLADIACDHATLAEAAVACGRSERAIAIDIASGPLMAAAARIRPANLAALELRLGDGFALQAHEADCGVVAGIGGTLLATLLLRDRPRNLGLQRLVLSPHGDEDEVREALAATGWRLDRETLLREHKRFYVVMEASWAEAGASGWLSREQAIVGRLGQDADATLLREFAEAKRRKLRREIAGLRQGNAANPRLPQQQEVLQVWAALIASLPPAS